MTRRLAAKDPGGRSRDEDARARAAAVGRPDVHFLHAAPATAPTAARPRIVGLAWVAAAALAFAGAFAARGLTDGGAPARASGFAPAPQSPGALPKPDVLRAVAPLPTVRPAEPRRRRPARRRAAPPAAAPTTPTPAPTPAPVQAQPPAAPPPPVQAQPPAAPPPPVEAQPPPAPPAPAPPPTPPPRQTFDSEG